MPTTSARIVATAVLFLALGCNTSPGKGGPDDPGLPRFDNMTYYADIKPIIDAKCAGCHYQGGIAPFALTSYDTVKPQTGISKLAVEAKTMPPWGANSECDSYLGDRSLTREQMGKFVSWVEDGAPPGDPASEGPPLPKNSTRLSRIDRMLAIAEPYTPTRSPDDYRCFLIPWQETSTQYATGFGAIPGNAKIVHHIIAFLAEPSEVATYQRLDSEGAGPGYSCFGGTGGPADAWLGAWAPGSEGSDFPDGTGIRVEPGSLIVLQVHYNLVAAQAAPDQTQIALKLDARVDKEAWVQPWTNPLWVGGGMRIAAGDPDATFRFALDPTRFFNNNRPFLIHAAALHMHQLGSRGTLFMDPQRAPRDCLLQIDRWDFNWQDSYGFVQPKLFNPNDQLGIECHFDNSPPNQPIENGKPRQPRDVSWGEGTQDEMCLGIFYVSQP